MAPPSSGYAPASRGSTRTASSPQPGPSSNLLRLTSVEPGARVGAGPTPARRGRAAHDQPDQLPRPPWPGGTEGERKGQAMDLLNGKVAIITGASKGIGGS